MWLLWLWLLWLWLLVAVAVAVAVASIITELIVRGAHAYNF